MLWRGVRLKLAPYARSESESVSHRYIRTCLNIGLVSRLLPIFISIELVNKGKISTRFLCTLVILWHAEAANVLLHMPFSTFGVNSTI